MHNVSIRRIAKFFGVWLLALGFSWGPTEPIVFGLGDVAEKSRYDIFASLVVGSLIVAIGWSHRKKSIVISEILAREVEVKFGDLFWGAGRIAIACDDRVFVESDKVKAVNEKSMIALAAKWMGRLTPSRFASELRESMGYLGPDTSLPVGASGHVTVNGNTTDEKTVIATVLCRIGGSPMHGRASAEDLWKALMGLWEYIYSHPRGDEVRVALIGSGQTATGLAPKSILHMMLCSMAASEKAGRSISDKIVIVLHASLWAKIDLRAIQKAWERE